MPLSSSLACCSLGFALLLPVGCCGTSDSAAERGPHGCASDVDCKGQRICSQGKCVDPAVPAAPAPPPPTPLATSGSTARRPPRAAPTVRSRAVPVAEPFCGCKLDGVIYENDGTVWGCEGGGNWCANAPPLAGGCPQAGCD